MSWNISEAVYRISQTEIADRPALIHGDESISYRELVRRCSGIASWLQTLGLPSNAHVGHYMRNSNAYMETFIGAGLAGMAHVNVNFRYLDQELIDLCVSLDIRVLVYDAEFAERVADIKDQLSETVGFVEVGAAPARNDFAITMGELYDYDSSGFERQCSSDDLMIVATGGTTGLPKGTMWRQEDLWFKQKMSTGNAMIALRLDEHPADLDEHVANVLKLPEPKPFMPLSPLMHGAASLMAILMLAQGIAVLTAPGEKFSADQTLDLIQQYQVSGLALVGDAFAIPLVEALDRRGNEDLFSSIKMLVSTGASLSEDYRDGFLRHQPNLILFDTLGSSEASGFAVSTPEPGVFKPMETTRVFDDELNDVVPGSDTIGIAYSGGYSPIGYYKQPEKSAETFMQINGERFVKTGDRCTVRADGMLILLGRDSTVINTGGEKVYTVEVERALMEHSAITDCLVVGVPHPRFGSMVVAVVEGTGLNADTINVSDIQEQARAILADYKIPRQIFAIDSLQRAPNGKPDYPFITNFAKQQLEEKQHGTA
jgi:acyl-CoA synthetase (AMP-forming)/AMP-acid ligase II